MSVIEIKATVPRVKSVPAGFGGIAPRRRRLTMTVGFAVLRFRLPPVTGDVEVFALHLVGLGIGALLLRRLMSRRRVPRLKH